MDAYDSFPASYADPSWIKIGEYNRESLLDIRNGLVADIAHFQKLLEAVETELTETKD